MSKIEIKHSNRYIDYKDLSLLEKRVEEIHKILHSKEEYKKMPLGWIDAPFKISSNEIKDITKSAKALRKTSQIIVSIGIGGSYLGSRAAIEMLQNPSGPTEPSSKDVEIIFAGNNISSPYLCSLMKKIKDKDFSLIVVSKSGTTLETSIAFRVFKDYLEKVYGKEEARKRIIVITDKTKGDLRKAAIDKGYESYEIPNNLGGRYSVLTPAGLYTIAAAGIDISKIIQGAQDAYETFNNKNLYENPCYKYAAIRNILYDRGKDIEVFVTYEPSMAFFSEWWKQLFGESEGKEGKGLFPASLEFTRDLHSMGQYLQEGRRNIFETILFIKSPQGDIDIPIEGGSHNGVDYLKGRTLNEINDIAYKAVKEAHEEGGVPCISLEIQRQDEYHFGYLVYFFQKACAVSGYLLGVNPFDQPGVEMYKSNIFKLMGR